MLLRCLAGAGINLVATFETARECGSRWRRMFRADIGSGILPPPFRLLWISGGDFLICTHPSSWHSQLVLFDNDFDKHHIDAAPRCANWVDLRSTESNAPRNFLQVNSKLKVSGLLLSCQFL